MSTDAVAVGRLAVWRDPTEAEIQAGIDAAMRETIAGAGHNPQALEAPTKVSVAGAPRVTDGPSARGWAEPRPLALPPGQDHIERLVNAFEPHGPESPLRRKGGQG